MQHISFMLEMHGSTDHRIWQRLGDVTTLVFALGLHQREVDERAPFFLSEIRKRTMVAAYSMDKELATFLGRPPRICRRYCNFHIPLDIGWEDLLADASTRDAVVQRLDANGWDSRGGSEGAKPRVSMLSNIYREMILELSFSREMDNLMHKIEEIRHESNHMRLGLPIFLRWSPENEHPSAASLHLEFLYQDFLLCQMLVERAGDGSNSLIEKSLEILVLLLDIVSKQTRAGNVSHFTIFDLCYIGLPAAGVLSKELLRHSQESGGGHPRESNFARSEIIQRLSVFAAQLETFFPSREGDYDTCMKGLAFIRQVLDIVLTPNTTDSSMLGCDVAREEENDLLAGPCTDDIELLALMEDFDWEQEMRPFSS
ncbi:uncharacterized protein N7515_003909 [Penicillium bovifimosum]|uniref:Xylanolytic transcriptional activator regulatory domain-containing protein n=1 Tax=Penicillium bovifimosum TaxID=126998 RepID=A0A9W9H607_9EURO|nr:uncharacterized protein N7515_003909 [Penicillium bovifimosum]KAJ5139061.1 hypothetical protein N7515_003909 [Penicillium bovifimosum]